MTEKSIKVVILDSQGQVYIYPNSWVDMDITLEELVDAIKAEQNLRGEYEIYVSANDLNQKLSGLRITPKNVTGIVILPAAMRKPKIRLR